MTNEIGVNAPATQILAQFCVEEIFWERLPSQVRERAQELLLDFIGVALRGSREASSAPAIELARSWNGRGEARVIGGGFEAQAPWGALANGTTAHAIEMDDVTRESSLHPGVAVIPAALALGQERNAAPTAFLEAIIAGYEMTIRVGNALNPAATYARGFHPTGVAGVFGAATATARILRLNAEQLGHALGIAGTMASGSLEYLADGAWTKRLNAGWAAHAGVVAATLAQHGFRGPGSALEGRLGALHAFSEAAAPERLLVGLGAGFEIERVAIKPYACCRYNHGLIDGMLALRREHGLQPAGVAEIRLGVLSGGALLVAEPIEQKRTPQNVVDAQFSAPFAAALALVRGSAGWQDYGQANVEDRTIRGLMARTSCVRDDALDAVYPEQWPAWVEVQLVDGRTLRADVPYARGEPENPVSKPDLVLKFVDLAADSMPAGAARRLAEKVLHLEEQADLGVLASL